MASVMTSRMTFIFCQGPARQQSGDSSQPLPPGWEACTDQATGRTYYQCHHTQATQWEHPAHTDHEALKQVVEHQKRTQHLVPIRGLCFKFSWSRCWGCLYRDIYTCTNILSRSRTHTRTCSLPYCNIHHARALCLS